MSSSSSLADSLLDSLATRYETPVIPACSECGGPLRVIAATSRISMTYACADAVERYASEPGVHLHYIKSLTRTSNNADPEVQLLVEAMRKLTSTDFRIQSVLEDAVKENKDVLDRLEANRILARV